MLDPTALTTWLLTDGKPGMENQCLGLAEALGVTPAIKRIALRQPWASLPPQLAFRPLRSLAGGSDALAAPWPDLLIASGRATVALSIAIRRLSRGRTFTVQIQNPAVSLSKFDLVAAPVHDGLSAPNVISTHGSLNRVQAARIAVEAERFRDAAAHLPRPLVMVSLGGDNKVYRMTPAVIDRLARDLRTMVEQDGAGLLVTPSRRTGADNERRLRAALAGLPHLWWDGTGDNPYLGWTGLADAFVVTGDSVNMVSEACGTGKPVMVVHLEGGNDKFGRFHTAMADAGLTRPFAGRLLRWTYPPLDDTATVAAAVRARLAARQQTSGGGAR
ncbi:MAG: mitochondrial fission ELM1 family protein [Pseudomonadota bacterium]|nr:mitochondrial fission ELM1 family protein [Pseudomonadota bacterium]